MENLISKETESHLKKLGFYQIIGGAVGILIIVWSILKNSSIREQTIIVYFFILLFFVYSIFCGTLCLKATKNALRHSLANQLLQLIGFALMGFAFQYVAGFYLTVELDLTNSVNFGIGVGVSKFDFNFNNEQGRLEVDFNLVAFALVYWIDKLMKRIKEEEAINIASSIGSI